MEVDYGRFSIREYTRNKRSVEVRQCWPFSGDITGDLIQSLLPPITVAKFRWWSHELASLLTKSSVSVDDSDPPFRQMAKAKSRPCKKRSIVDICEATPKIRFAPTEDESDDFDVLIGSKRIRTKYHQVQKKFKGNMSEDFGDRKFANKVDESKGQAQEKVDGGKCSLGIEESSGVIYLSSNKAGTVSKVHDSEFQTPAILKAKRKVCFVGSPDKSETYSPQCKRHQVRFADQSGDLSQQKENTASVELCCLEMNRLSLSSSEDESPVYDKQVKTMSTNQTSVLMHLESRQQDKYQPAVSKSDLSFVLEPYLGSLQRVKDALDVEIKAHVAKPVQSFVSTLSESPSRSFSSFSQPASADMHYGTLLDRSPFDPFLVEWMQRSVLYRQRQVGEANLEFPLNLEGGLVDTNGEGFRSFDRTGLCTGSSISASAENAILLENFVDFSSEKKHSTETAFAKDSEGRISAHNEKCHKYFPARLGLDDGEFGQFVHSPVPEVIPRSHTIHMAKQNALNQNLNNRNVISKPDALCIQNMQAKMRLMGKDVSIGSSYSGMVRNSDKRIRAPDASIDYSSLGSYTQQSWLWRRTTLEVSENHSTTTLDKNWNKALRRDTSEDLFPLFCKPHVSLASQSRTDALPDSEFPPTVLNPCCSLASFPSSDKDLNFCGSGLGLPFSQQQLLYSSNYNNVNTGLLPEPDARRLSFGLPFSCADSTIRSLAPWPQNSFESSCSGMSFTNPSEQLMSFYGSKSASSINVGTTNNRLASVEGYPMKNHKIPKLPMQSGLNSAKFFFAGQEIRRSPI